MVATAPGEKLLIGRRPVRNWTRRTISSLFLCGKLHLFLGKSTKTAATRAALFDSNMHQIVTWGFTPDPTGGAYSAPPDSLAVFSGGTSKGMGRESSGGEGREFVLCLGKKKEKSAPMTTHLETWPNLELMQKICWLIHQKYS